MTQQYLIATFSTGGAIHSANKLTYKISGLLWVMIQHTSNTSVMSLRVESSDARIRPRPFCQMMLGVTPFP
jgi:hypothetical protein